MRTPTRATATISSKGQLTLPKEVRERLGVDKGDEVEFTLDDQGKPEEAATAATRLIASDHVTAILGEAGTSIDGSGSGIAGRTARRPGRHRTRPPANWTGGQGRPL